MFKCSFYNHLHHLYHNHYHQWCVHIHHPYRCIITLVIWCFSPQYPDWFVRIVKYIVTFTAYCNSAINPILYGALNENFRQGFREAFKCSLCLRRNQINPGQYTLVGACVPTIVHIHKHTHTHTHTYIHRLIYPMEKPDLNTKQLQNKHTKHVVTNRSTNAMFTFCIHLQTQTQTNK